MPRSPREPLCLFAVAAQLSLAHYHDRQMGRL